MAEYLVDLWVTVKVTVNDPDVIDRCVDDDDGWRTRMFYPLDTRDKVLEHLAYNAAANGETDLGHLDGWADLPRDAAEMQILSVDTEGIEEPDRTTP